MVNAVFGLSLVLAFVVGFISGQLFTALQFASGKHLAKASPEAQAKKSVDRLLELGRKV